MAHNPNCDGDQCRQSSGEVRVLPLGAGGNLILCRACYQHEIAFRRERNKKLSPNCRFDLPPWEALQVGSEENEKTKHPT